MINPFTYRSIRLSVTLLLLMAGGLLRCSASVLYQVDGDLSTRAVLQFQYQEKAHQVALIEKDGQPHLYESDLLTPVCDDGVCELLRLKVYWDLLGNYRGFDTLDTHPLTKYDHSPFLSSDYEKLHALLKDKASSLKTLKMSDLVSSVGPGEVDAHSGATAQQIQDEIVTGAAYSCHVLWHIMNDVGQKAILDYTKQNLDKTWIRAMFNAEDQAYADFLLASFSSSDYASYHQEIEDLLRRNVWAVECIVQHLPEGLQLSASLQENLLSHFGEVAAMTRFQLLELLKKQSHLTSASLDYLSAQLYELSYMQMQELEAIYAKNATKLSSQAKSSIRNYVADPKAKYAFLLEQVLGE